MTQIVGPFWAWADIDGEGPRWLLAYRKKSEVEQDKIYYPMEEFDDFWYDDDWDEGEIVPIKYPERSP